MNVGDYKPMPRKILADDFVVVGDATLIANLPDTGVSPYFNISIWGILGGVLTVLILFFVLIRKSALRKLRALTKLILIALFFLGVAGTGFYLAFLPKSSPDAFIVIAPNASPSPNLPITKFPQTGPGPSSLTLVGYVKNLYATPQDALVTSLLLLLIAYTAAKVVRPSKRQVEIDLENARIAARNVLEDLQIEKMRLAEANAKDEALLESIGEGVVAVDQGGGVIIMNRVAEELLGFTSQEMMGESYVRAFHLENMEGIEVPDIQEPIRLVLTAGKATTAIYTCVRKNGTKFPTAITATPVLMNTKPDGAIVVFRDITREKEIERLRQDFMSLASHQLRTPLSGTKWLIETMRRKILGTFTEKQTAYLDQLYELNERMIQLVSEMLSALRLESGAAPITKEVVLISSLYEDLPVLVMATAKSRNIKIRSTLKEHATLTIETDREILKSILECFVSNAIEYSEFGQEVVMDVEEKADATVFSVQDNGIGIPKDEQKRIYERFYRTSNAKAFKPGGSGLGLYIADVLAGKIGAKISFISEEGKGATFYLRIPKRVASPHASRGKR